MEIRTEIEVDAPASEVWATLTDFPSYPEWNPFIVHASGNLDVGAKLEVVLSPPDGRETTFRPKVLVVEPGRELRWRGHVLIPGLLDGEHFFRLTELEPNRTRFTHGEDFTGLLVRFAKGALTNATRGFVFMNQALKRRIEEQRRT